MSLPTKTLYLLPETAQRRTQTCDRSRDDNRHIQILDLEPATRKAEIRSDWWPRRCMSAHPDSEVPAEAGLAFVICLHCLIGRRNFRFWARLSIFRQAERALA